VDTLPKKATKVRKEGKDERIRTERRRELEEAATPGLKKEREWKKKEEEEMPQLQKAEAGAGEN